MEFLSEYYLWFVIGGIILVMAVIGYIADKTDFGRKNKITAENNKLKEEKENNDSITETPAVALEEVSQQEPVVSDVVDIIEPINDSTNEMNVSIIEEPITEDSSIIIDEQPTNESLGNIKIEENNIEQPAINDTNEISINDKEKIEIKEVIDDSTYVLNNDLSSFAAGAVNEVPPVTNVVEEVINDQDNDDDIWKF